MVSFKTLWDNHPGIRSSHCNFTNQCAIRMGIALQKSKVNIDTFNGVVCWFGHNDPKHILRAQELADWMSFNSEFRAKEIHKNVTSKDFVGKTGIVFIKDGWGATDHIDVWNGLHMKGGLTNYFSKGREVWFWNII